MNNKSTIIATIFAALLLPFAIVLITMWIPTDWYSSPAFWVSLVIDAVVICSGIVLCRLNRMIGPQERDEPRNEDK